MDKLHIYRYDNACFSQEVIVLLDFVPFPLKNNGDATLSKVFVNELKGNN